MSPSPCKVENCRQPATPDMCSSHAEVWHKSPEKARALVAKSEAAGRTALCDFFRRVSAELRNGVACMCASQDPNCVNCWGH